MNWSVQLAECYDKEEIMINKPLLTAIIGFILGGLLVSVVATTQSQPQQSTTGTKHDMGDMTMSGMTSSLVGKTGDGYDSAFIQEMIEHHEGAVEMAKLSASRAKHDEIKKLSQDIITAQEKEIAQMKQWQANWGYDSSDDSGMMMH